MAAVRRASGPPPSHFAAPQGAVDRYRPKTPAETLDAAYLAPVKATALNAVTHMALDSMDTVEAHREAIAEARPDIAPILEGLRMNHARNLAMIQNQIVDDQWQEKR